jgi:esterase/lipase
MKSIYFSNQNKTHHTRNILTKASHFTTSAMVKVAPGVGKFIGLKVLCNPFSKRNYNFKTQATPEVFDIESQDGNVRAYYFKGGNKNILLSHGWSDNSSAFSDMIQFLLDEGHSVWTFDHIGHGESHGSTAHLFAFINGLNAVINFIEEQKGLYIDSLIGHSMGAVAIMNLDKEYINNRKTIFIATPVNFFEIMFQRIGKAGFSDCFLHNLLDKVSKQYDGDWKRLRPYNQLPKLNENTIFVHDLKDKYAPHYDIEVAKESTNFNLISTSGLGHARILRSKEIKEIIQGHLS